VNLNDLIRKYADGGDVIAPDYRSELAAARASANEEQKVYNDLIQKHITSGESPESKSEMWFKLAAALGAPTKTGTFGETLGNAAGALGEYKKDARAEAVNKLQLALDAQKMKTQSAKDNVSSIRDMYKLYQEESLPKSSAGKQALDEGFKVNSPEYQGRVKEIGDLEQARKSAIINAQTVAPTLAQQNLTFKKEQATRLTAPELKLKTDTSDAIMNLDQAMSNISKAYNLNPNTFDNSTIDKAQRLLLENTSPNDPKVKSTRLLENLLTEDALSQLKTAFGGNPTEGERAILLSVQGIGAKSIPERDEILKNTRIALQNKRKFYSSRLNDLNQGAYRTTTPANDVPEE
jgi:hypothetical protein